MTSEEGKYLEHCQVTAKAINIARRYTDHKISKAQMEHEFNSLVLEHPQYWRNIAMIRSLGMIASQREGGP